MNRCFLGCDRFGVPLLRRMLPVALATACVHLDRTAPTLTIDAPSGTTNGPIPLTVTAQEQPSRWPTSGIASLALSIDGQPVISNASDHIAWTWLPHQRSDGVHHIQAEVSDYAGNTAHAEAWVATDDTPPAVSVSVVPPAPAQGTAFAVFVAFDEPVSDATLAGLSQAVHLAPTGGVWRALLGVRVEDPAVPAPFALQVADAWGNSRTCTVTVPISSTPFPNGGTIKLTKTQVAARTDEAALAKMRADRNEAYRYEDPRQHWSGGVQRPIEGRRTSAFGRYRSYTDGRKSHHLGTDIANIPGTPVHASLDGIVRAAGWHHLFGNAVIIHHGQGLTTSYNHLTVASVNIGEPVVRGEVVGTVGATGQSTGPHLHWGMQVGEVEVDPEAWPDHGFAPDVLSSFPLTPANCSPSPTEPAPEPAPSPPTN